jgi:hypothetical protein
VDLVGDNISNKQALKHPGWTKAMESELASILKTQKWELVELPLGITPLTCCWVSKLSLLCHQSMLVLMRTFVLVVLSNNMVLTLTRHLHQL